MNHKSIFYHCPNGPISSGLGAHVSESFKSACDQVLLHPDKSGCSDRVCFITYSNYSTKTLIEEFYEARGIHHYFVLARELEQWSWMNKIQTVYDFLCDGCAEVFDYIVATDATDVGILGELPELVQRFEHMECDLLFCPTCANWPPVSSHAKFEDKQYSGVGHQHYRLSAGAYMARPDALKECLAEIIDLYSQNSPDVFRAPVWIPVNESRGLVRSKLSSLRRYLNDWRSPRCFDDQQAWRALHVKHYPKIRVDVQSYVFARYDSRTIDL